MAESALADSSFAREEGTPFAVRLFGRLELVVEGQPLPRLRSRRGEWLLALLILRAGQPVERAWLAGLFWPESTEARARYNLRRTLVDLRDALGTQAGRLTSPTPRTLSVDLA